MPILPRTLPGYKCISNDGKILLKPSCNYVIYLIVLPIILFVLYALGLTYFEWMKTVRARFVSLWAKRKRPTCPVFLGTLQKSCRYTFTRLSSALFHRPGWWSRKNIRPQQSDAAVRSVASEEEAGNDVVDSRQSPTAEAAEERPQIPRTPPPVYLVSRKSTDSDIMFNDTPPPLYTHVPSYPHDLPMPYCYTPGTEA